MAGEAFTLTLRQQDGYRFIADFGEDGPAPLTVDEALPIGDGEGPNPVRLLAVAVAHCLSASLLFCLKKRHIAIHDLRTTIEGRLERNERGRLRIGGLRVTLEPSVSSELWESLGPCLDVFEDYCLVTGSVRDGIDVEVSVEPVEAEVAAAL
jgi:uncharacterized OsmC-like protein